MDKLCRIRDLQRAVNQFEAAFEKRYGICLNEGMALCSLSNAERMCPGRLGELLGLTPSNTSKVLRSVEGKGYVNRELGTNDKRQMYFSLTEAGRAELERLQPCRVALPELLASGFHHPQQAIAGGERGRNIYRKIESTRMLINILHGLLQDKGREQQPGVVGAELRQKSLRMENLAAVAPADQDLHPL